MYDRKNVKAQKIERWFTEMRDFLIFIILIVLLLHIARLSKLDTDLSAYVSDLQEQIDEIYNEQHPDEYLIRQELIKERDGD